MTLNALIAVLGLLALLLLIAAGRNMRRHRIGGGIGQFILALLFLAVAAGAVLVATNLRTYQRLTAEEPAGVLVFNRIGYHQFHGVLTYPTGESADFELRGDEWQIDARVLKWQGLASVFGYDTAYRLDRIGGRYTNIDDERSLPRTVYSLHPPERIDLWELVQRHHVWLPWIDALYGSATFLPMADAARYAISVSQTGLVARPLNSAASSAVAEWH